MILYHNPRCRKSREALQLLSDKGIKPTIVEYLKNPLTTDELDALRRKLNIPVIQWIRKGEEPFKQFKGKEMSDQDWILAVAEYPKLMERPILVNNDKAIVGRPPENVLEII